MYQGTQSAMLFFSFHF